jgi:hypothetical protein
MLLKLIKSRKHPKKVRGAVLPKPNTPSTNFFKNCRNKIT